MARVFDRAWFADHQPALLWALNAPVIGSVVRSALQIDLEGPLVALTPSSVTVLRDVTPDGVVLTTDCRTHAKYAKRLAGVGAPLWRLFHEWDRLVDLRVPALSFGFSTLTAYPDPGDPGSGSPHASGDTWIGRLGVDETWATLIAGAGISLDPTYASAALVRIDASTTSNQWARLQRGWFHFDTGALGSGASISAATLSLFGESKADAPAWAPTVNLYSSTVTSGNTFAASDFVKVGSTAFATAITYSGWSTTAYNDFALNASGLANISKTGVSKFSGRNANYDVAAVAPTWSSAAFAAINCFHADQTGTTNDPKLVVTYTTTSTVAPLAQFLARQRRR